MQGRRIVAITVTLLFWPLASARAADLSKIDRSIAKEPKYQSQPKYCLLVFGADAKHKAWLVLDGDTLYVDRQGEGDLTQPECRVEGQADKYRERYFKAGDLTVGGKRYADLQVAISSAKSLVGSFLAEAPMFKKFLAQKEGKLFSVGVDVPFDKPLPNLRDGSPLKSTRHYASEYDANGILQFADRPEQAPIIHFGGPWTMWPDVTQKLVRGRNEDLVLRLGTSGHGPGTFAVICYDLLIPDSAKPHLRIEYPSRPGDKPLVQNYVLEDRC